MMNRPVRQIMRREVNEFAIVQKDIHGLDILAEEYKKRLSRYGVTPTMWIFPPKMPVPDTLPLVKPAFHNSGCSLPRLFHSMTGPFMRPWFPQKQPPMPQQG